METKVTLPSIMTVNIQGIGSVCEPAQAAAHACPANTSIGDVSINTPLLPAPVTGTVYVARTLTGSTLPDLLIELPAPINMQIRGANSFVNQIQIQSSFDNLPDLVWKDITMHITGGAHGILGLRSNGVCGDADTSFASWSGQQISGAKSQPLRRAPRSRSAALGVRAWTRHDSWNLEEVAVAPRSVRQRLVGRQRRLHFVDAGRAADLVGVEDDVLALRQRFLRSRPAVEERRANDECIGMVRADERFGLELRLPICGHRARLGILGVRGALLAVEDEVGGEMDQARADAMSRKGDVAAAAGDRL